MKISVIGTGYVGLIQSVGLAEFGFDVVGIDIDETKVKHLNGGKCPLYEDGLEELLQKHVGNKLKFTTSYDEIKDSDVIFLCVGTPQDDEGNADLRFIYSATESIKNQLDDSYKILVIKSTVPIGTNRNIKELLKDYNVDVVSNPEFLREGIAVYDFFNPERIVLGFENLNNEKPIDIMKEIYSHFDNNIPFIITDWESAEMIKYASNAFLATKISFVNELSKLADKVGADIKTISEAMGIDKRIGNKFLNAGIGYGGSCFHPDEVLFVDFGKGLECMTFKELFDELSKDSNRMVKILSIDENLKLDLVDLKLITKRDYSDDLIVLKTSMGRELKITKDHPVVVMNENKLNIKLAEDIKEGDEIALPNGEFNNNNNIITIDVLEEIKNTPLIENTYLNNKDMVLNEFENIRTHLSNKYVHDVKKNGTVRAKDMLPLRNLLNKYNYNSNRLFTVRSKSTTIPSKIKIDNDFARLIGYYLAEGWISEDNGRNRVNRKRISFSFGGHEDEYINDVKNILSKLDINYIEKVGNGSHSIVISSKLLAYIFEEVLKCGNNCYNKQIPPQIFNSPEDIKWEFLKGILRGDGGIVRLNNNKNLNIEYGTVSKKLANSLMILLQSFGITTSLKRCYNNKSTVLTYIIRINGLNQVKKIGELFGEKWNNYKEIADNYQRNIKPTGYKKFDNYATLKVKSIEREHYNEEVYSVETDNNLLISSYGMLIHNCFPKDVKALIKQFENNNISPKLVKATDEVNEEQICWFFNKIKNYYNGNLNQKTFAVLGLAFKPNTDDLRESRGIKLIDLLLKSGAIVKGFDYVEKARENTINRYKLDKSKAFYGYNLYVLDDLYETVKDADAIIITTEYDFNNEDWEMIKKLVKNKTIFDGRNILNADKIKKLGFEYYGVGRK